MGRDDDAFPPGRASYAASESFIFTLHCMDAQAAECAIFYGQSARFDSPERGEEFGKEKLKSRQQNHVYAYKGDTAPKSQMLRYAEQGQACQP